MTFSPSQRKRATKALPGVSWHRICNPLKSLEEDNAQKMKDHALAFERVFCGIEKISEQDFCPRLLVKSARWHARPVLRFMIAFFPWLLTEDFHQLDRLRGVRTRHEFSAEMMSVARYNKNELPLWRRVLGLRSSITNLAQQSVPLRLASQI